MNPPTPTCIPQFWLSAPSTFVPKIPLTLTGRRPDYVHHYFYFAATRLIIIWLFGFTVRFILPQSWFWTSAFFVSFREESLLIRQELLKRAIRESHKLRNGKNLKRLIHSSAGSVSNATFSSFVTLVILWNVFVKLTFKAPDERSEFVTNAADIVLFTLPPHPVIFFLLHHTSLSSKVLFFFFFFFFLRW